MVDRYNICIRLRKYLYMSTERSSGHLVDPSIWPLIMSVGIYGMCSGLVVGLNGGSWNGEKLGMILTVISLVCWLRDVIREGSYEGLHSERVRIGLRLGMVLFIVSELMFFFAFFWGFLWYSTTITVSIGGVFPPHGYEVIDSKGVALMNTILLLSSGVTVTWSHHAIVCGDRRGSIEGMSLTILLAILFTILQGYEYLSSDMSISDSVFGSAFYMTTGFHGLHLIIGSIMLIVGLVRIRNYEITNGHHIGLDGGTWYWHFVDVVWLFLYILMYVLVN